MACSKQRFPMSPSRRAKQFMAFDALKGFKEAIEATERFTEPRRELSEDGEAELNSFLIELKPGDMVTVEYYSETEMRYPSISGEVKRIDSIKEILEVENVSIDWYNIYNISF